ncbi:MAG: alpha/beta hydrolase-fold protein [Fodinibius sp.]|nr:alpha/beta hydrolase-fold protein [Fodinibius sp.]
MKISAALLTCILLLVPMVASAQVTDFTAKTYQDSAGNELSYRILKPANYDTTKSYPLVLFLHGAGERGSDNYSQLKWGVSHFADPQFREKYPAFVVAPQVPEGETWAGLPSQSTSSYSHSLSQQPTQPMQLTIGLLDSLQQNFNIDLARIYVTGISMGGFGTFDLIQRMPQQICRRQYLFVVAEISQRHFC